MSKYLKNENALFLHIPKTGGIWVSEAMQTLGIAQRLYSVGWEGGTPKAYSLLLHHDHTKEINFKFAFVRNPVAYYESVFREISIGKNRKANQHRFTWHPFQSVSKIWDKDFNIWISRILEFEPSWMTRLIEWYVGPKNSEFCDFVGKTENLVNDLTKAVILAGVDKDAKHIKQTFKQVPKSNKSKKNIKIVWDTSLKGQILSTEAAYMNRFNYS